MIDILIQYGVGLVALVFALFGVWKVGKSAGKTKAEAAAKSEQADIRVATSEKANKAETETLTTVNEVQNETAKLSTGAIADKLRDQYTRDQINN